MYHNTVHTYSLVHSTRTCAISLRVQNHMNLREAARGKISVRCQMFETRCRGLARFLPRSLSPSLSPFTPLHLCALFLLVFINIVISLYPLEEFRNRFMRNWFHSDSLKNTFRADLYLCYHLLHYFNQDMFSMKTLSEWVLLMLNEYITSNNFS